jgi:hypothetical protein
MELRKLINLFTEQQAPQPQTDRQGSFRGTTTAGPQTANPPAAPMKTAQDFTPSGNQPNRTGPRQGVVGSELARTSSGQFTSRADRLNQDKVNAALGVNPATGKPYVAGRADTNLALRNLYRQGGPQPAVAPAPVEPSPPPPSASNEKSKETVAAAPKVDAPAADAPAPKAVAYPQPPVADIDSATAAERSGQNIGGQFAKAASDKAAQDSFALVTGMAPKLDARSAVPAAPTADAPAAAPMRTAQDFAGSGTVDPPEQPKGVFSKFMPGQAGADNEAGGVAQSQAQPAAPAKTYGGGYDPNKVQYAVDQPKVPALAPNQIGTGTPGVGLVDRDGKPVTSGANLKRGPMGNIINEVDVEEADPNLPKYNPLAKTAVPNSAPNKQPSMYDIERANKKEIASQFDPKSTYVNPYDKDTKASSPGSKSVNTVADFEESLEHELAEMLRLSGLALNEKAPPGAKAERMVKHIKKGYAKDGKLSDKEKSIAFATAWKAKKAGKLDESFHLMLDEGGHTLSHVVNRFKHEVKKFLNGEEMSDNLYDALYDYYLDSGEMPYGVAKAREGDPYSWISDRFYNDIEGIVNVKQPVDEVAHSTAMKDLDRLATLAGLTTEGATDAGLPMPLSMPPLEKKQLIPSMSESVRSLEECGDMGMDQDNSMDQESVFSVNTNMTSDGKKDVTVTASGDRAEELLAMLKLAGMERHSTRRPSALFVSGDEQMMEREVTPVPDDGNKLGGMGDFEQIDAIDEAKKTRITRHANTPDEEYQTVASITRQGNDLNREKKQFANKARLGDNPMAEGQMEFDRELVDLLDSVLIKKDVDENSNTPNPYPVGQDALSPQEKLNPTNNPNKSIVRGILDFVTKPTKPGM